MNKSSMRRRLKNVISSSFGNIDNAEAVFQVNKLMQYEWLVDKKNILHKVTMS